MLSGFFISIREYMAFPEKIEFFLSDGFQKNKEKLNFYLYRVRCLSVDVLASIFSELLNRFLFIIPINVLWASFLITSRKFLYTLFVDEPKLRPKPDTFDNDDDDFYIEPKLYLRKPKFYLSREFYYNIYADSFWISIGKKFKKSFRNLSMTNYNSFSPKYRYANRLSIYNSSIYSNAFDGTAKVKLKHQLKFGFSSVNKAIRIWVLPFATTVLFLFFLVFIRLLPVNTAIFQMFGLLMFFYWLISGFVFFIKKYKFSKFTSVIQRFWRRAYILFWLLESCLLIVFLYLTLNASQESVYSLDQIAVFKSHNNSIKFFIPKIMLSTILIVLGYLLLLNLKWNFFRKQIIFVAAITIILIFNLMQESYQMFHALNFYSNLFWTYSIEDKLWSLEFDARRTRLVNHYTIILLILKYWHVVFIYFFWVFTTLRANESSSVNYPIYSANFQNFVILFIMSFISLYPQLKLLLAPFFTEPYFWFFLNPNSTFVLGFFNDIKLFSYSVISSKSLNFYLNYDFFYYSLYDSGNSFSLHRKQFIKNIIVNSLN
jgi:hypothetical protein